VAKAVTPSIGPKGCCKAPAAPARESKVRSRTPVVMETAAMEAGALAQGLIELPPAAAMRLARRAHHAEAPDESPPDLLQRTHALLI
jgi:hypothetical protein